MLRSAAFCFIFILSIFCGRAQDNSFGFGVKHYRGMMWAHRKSILHLEAPSRGVDADFYLAPGDRIKKWQHQYRKPLIGVSLNYLDLGKRDTTGLVLGVLPFIEFRIIQKPKFNLNFRMSTGLGYITKKWDIETNALNKAIGSHINGNMRLHFISRMRLIPGLNLELGGGITHYSNGNFYKPNLGINSIEYFLGLSWGALTLPKAPRPDHSIDTGSGLNHWEISVGAATKVNNYVYPNRVWVKTLGLRFYRQLWDISRLGGGVEFAQDPQYVFNGNRAYVTETPGLSNSTEITGFLGHELLIGNFTFLTEGGIYFYRPYLLKGPIFQKLGIKYRFWENFQARALIKAHFVGADYIECGITYTISR